MFGQRLSNSTNPRDSPSSAAPKAAMLDHCASCRSKRHSTTPRGYASPFMTGA